MPPEPSIALVLLNYNGKAYLQRNLPFLKNVHYSNKKIYVIDNHSNDESVPFLKSTHPDITLIKNSANLGYAGGYNSGLVHIDADYYVLLNTDVEVTENFVHPLIRLMESDINIGICQPKILSLADRSFFEYAGAAGGWIDIFGYTFARGRVFDHCEKDDGQYPGSTRIFWTSGACMVIRSSLFRKMNGFYEPFFMYCEEVDLCWRAIVEGKTIVSCGESAVYHRETSLLLHQSPKRLYYLFRNNLIMLHRNLPSTAALWVIPIRLFLNAAAIFYFLLKGHFRIAFFTITAQFAYLKWSLSKKTSSSSITKKSLHQISTVYKGSIIYDYYLLGKKKFSDIVKSTK